MMKTNINDGSKNNNNIKQKPGLHCTSNQTGYSRLSTYQPLLTLIQSEIPNILAVYAFGSRVTGCAHENSDLDLAVLVAGYTTPYGLWDLSSQLAELAGCHVDLLDMRAASTVMQYQILQTGIVLFAKQPDAGLFECFVLSEKIALDTARAELLNDIQQRGKVYA